MAASITFLKFRYQHDTKQELHCSVTLRWTAVKSLFFYFLCHVIFVIVRMLTINLDGWFSLRLLSCVTICVALDSELWELMCRKLCFLCNVSLWICALVVNVSLNVWMSHCACVLVCVLQVVHQPRQVVSKLGVLRFFGGTQRVGEEGGAGGGGERKGKRWGGPGLIATNWIGCADQMGGRGSNLSCHSR